MVRRWYRVVDRGERTPLDRAERFLLVAPNGEIVSTWRFRSDAEARAASENHRLREVLEEERAL